MTDPRHRAALALALIAALLLAACGGGGDDKEDPQQCPRARPSATRLTIRSGNFDLDFKIETNGGDSPGTLRGEAPAGSSRARPSDRFPQFDFDVSLRAESGLAELLGQRRSHRHRRSGLREHPGTGIRRALSSSTTEFTSTYAQLQGQNGSQSGEPACLQKRSTSSLGQTGSPT